MLKDDKTYPFIKITHERHPRLIVTRNVKKTKDAISTYPNVQAARETKNCWTAFTRSGSAQSFRTASVFIIISDNASPHV